MSDDLVKRLRDLSYNQGHDLPDIAAARIEKLEAEVERLVKSRNKWGKLYNQTLEKLRLSVMSDSEYVKIIDEKCAEQADRIEQLQAALRWIVEQEKQTAHPTVCAIVETARKALEGKDD
jgi:hypothetical protein